ncbi:hypothetical protein [Ferruginibacter albus]|uniref:hypothetical protein n=1 Tax=Ferruginibacter albus TaxID=2875540 RepID=UPI001CC62BC0|nr:hypothetical protein [Ferruginibacter albus]UAY50659.1 hypothetical protein K9M53_08635 [Ferruginibacter albus]
MSNSIVFISKPAILNNTLPKTKPESFVPDFHYEINKPAGIENIALAIDLIYNIQAAETIFTFSTRSVCEIETKHSETEIYMILHRAMKVVIDNFRQMFRELNLEGYTNDIDVLFPYPKYDAIQPVLREIFNPAISFINN